MNTLTRGRRRALVAVAGVAAFVITLLATQDAAVAETLVQTTLKIPTPWVPVVSGFLTSGLTALATRLDARPWVKSLVGVILVGLSAVGQNIAMHDGSFVVGDLLDVFLLNIATHLGAYLMALKPLAVPARLAPESGLA